MVLLEVSLVNEPVVCTTPLTSVVEYVNVNSSTTEATSNVPLNPTSSVAAVFESLDTFLIIIFSPTLKSCGSSEITVTVFVKVLQVLINLGFLLYAWSSIVILVKPSSRSFLNPVVLDSCIINPSTGSLEFVTSLGTTTLNL